MRNRGYPRFSVAKLERDNLRKTLAQFGVQIPYQKYSIEYHQSLYAASRRDPENCFTKFVTDAFVEVGILQDDSFKELPCSPGIRAPIIIKPPDLESVQVIIKPID